MNWKRFSPVGVASSCSLLVSAALTALPADQLVVGSQRAWGIVGDQVEALDLRTGAREALSVYGRPRSLTFAGDLYVLTDEALFRFRPDSEALVDLLPLPRPADDVLVDAARRRLMLITTNEVAVYSTEKKMRIRYALSLTPVPRRAHLLSDGRVAFVIAGGGLELMDPGRRRVEHRSFPSAPALAWSGDRACLLVGGHAELRTAAGARIGRTVALPETTWLIATLGRQAVAAGEHLWRIDFMQGTAQRGAAVGALSCLVSTPTGELFGGRARKVMRFDAALKETGAWETESPVRQLALDSTWGLPVALTVSGLAILEAPAPPPPVALPPTSAGCCALQLGAFRIAENADRLARTLRAQGFPAYVSERDSVFRVRIGSFARREDALVFGECLAGFTPLVVSDSSAPALAASGTELDGDGSPEFVVNPGDTSICIVRFRPGAFERAWTSSPDQHLKLVRVEPGRVLVRRDSTEAALVWQDGAFRLREP